MDHLLYALLNITNSTWTDLQRSLGVIGSVVLH